MKLKKSYGLLKKISFASKDRCVPLQSLRTKYQFSGSKAFIKNHLSSQTLVIIEKSQISRMQNRHLSFVKIYDKLSAMPNLAITIFAPPPSKLSMLRRVHKRLPVRSSSDFFATSFPMSETCNLPCRLVAINVSQNL